MNLRQIRLVYFKEMKDILRDKRTIRLMILVPVIFYPLMSFGLGGLMESMARKEAARASSVLVVGEGAEFLSVLQLSDEVNPVDAAEFARRVLDLDAQDHSAAVDNLAAWQQDPVSGLPDSLLQAFYYSAIKGRAVDCVVDLPPGFSEAPHSVDTLMLKIYYDNQEFRSDAAESKVRRLAAGWRDTLTFSLLLQQGIDSTEAQKMLEPFLINVWDVAPAEKRTGFMLAMILPYMIMLTVMLGAMYPAIDLTAGEKERGTLETILASPAGRLEVTAGKFLCVFTAAMVTVLLGATSMTVTSGFGFAQLGNASADTGGFALAVNPAALGVVVLLMIPAAVFFSAALLALAVMARSYKEAQSYVTPLMFVAIIPSMVSFMPGVELNAALAWIPISNIAIAVKAAMITARGESFPWPLIGLVFLASAIYAGFALFLVRQMFNKESVLFRT